MAENSGFSFYDDYSMEDFYRDETDEQREVRERAMNINGDGMDPEVTAYWEEKEAMPYYLDDDEDDIRTSDINGFGSFEED